MKTFEIKALVSKKTNFIGDFEATNLEAISTYKRKGGEIEWVRCSTPEGKKIALEQGELSELHMSHGGVLLSSDGKDLSQLKIGDEVTLNSKVKFAREAGELMVIK